MLKDLSHSLLVAGRCSEVTVNTSLTVHTLKNIDLQNIENSNTQVTYKNVLIILTVFYSCLSSAVSDSSWPLWLARSGLTSCTSGRPSTTASEIRARARAHSSDPTKTLTKNFPETICSQETEVTTAVSRKLIRWQKHFILILYGNIKRKHLKNRSKNMY